MNGHDSAPHPASKGYIIIKTIDLFRFFDQFVMRMSRRMTLYRMFKLSSFRVACVGGTEVQRLYRTLIKVIRQNLKKMFSIREIDYETNEERERAFSRIPWAVEKVEDLNRLLML